MTQFSELGLSQPIVKALDELNFTTPTDIQRKSIPLLVGQSCDFIGLAQTGTGKTAAFGLPLLNQIDFKSPGIQSLILAPTRELAQQIAAGLNDFGKYIDRLNVEVVYGGADITRQIKQLKASVNVLVATPGRLLDLVKRKAVSLESIRYVVLDEADEMLNMGFKEDLNKILSFMPPSKSTWLFSATMPPAIQNIIHQYMDNPLEVSVNTATKVNVNIDHQYMVMKATDKLEAIKRVIDYNNDIYGVIFCRTKRETTEIAEALSKDGYSADALNGDLTQTQRDRVMKRFKSHNIKLLIATDVAARGIDVNDLTHVIHHRLPDELEFYTHRSGRTARAGKKGVSLVMATKGDLKKIKFFESKLKIEFTKKDIPHYGSIREKKIIHWAEALVAEEVGKDISTEEWQAVKQILEHIDKDQLVGKLLSRELKSMKNFDKTEDLNAQEDGRGSTERGAKRERGESKKSTTKGFVKFTMNVGKMDGATKKDFLDFVIEETGVNAKEVGDIVIDKTSSTFEIKQEVSDHIKDSFTGLIVNGRDVKVKKDSGGERASRGRSGGDRSPRSKSSRKGRRR